MKETFAQYIDESVVILNQKRVKNFETRIDSAIEEICLSLAAGNSMLVCGNGGSAADAMHIAGELVGRYLKERPAYKVIALSANPAVLTAWSNDYDFKFVFSRQVEAYGEKGGLLLGISTSGNSPNVIEAMKVARAVGMTTIGLTGSGGGHIAEHADILIDVPSNDTPRIQEVHICIYHYLCQRVEEFLT